MTPLSPQFQPRMTLPFEEYIKLPKHTDTLCWAFISSLIAPQMGLIQLGISTQMNEDIHED